MTPFQGKTLAKLFPRVSRYTHTQNQLVTVSAEAPSQNYSGIICGKFFRKGYIIPETLQVDSFNI